MSAPAWADPGNAYISFGGLSSLGATDDGSSPQTPLGFTLDYFGTDYTSVYVNENGDLTFTGPLSSYTPSGIGTVGTDIIAPFFADANSDNGGGITLYGATTFEGYSAFVAEWPGVDCYTDDGTASDVDNDFEVILINRPDLGVGDFQIEYNYDQVQWDAGEASDGTTSAPECQSTVNNDAAVVGFSNTSGSKSYELAGLAERRCLHRFELINGAHQQRCEQRYRCQRPRFGLSGAGPLHLGGRERFTRDPDVRLRLADERLRFRDLHHGHIRHGRPGHVEPLG